MQLENWKRSLNATVNDKYDNFVVKNPFQSFVAIKPDAWQGLAGAAETGKLDLFEHGILCIPGGWPRQADVHEEMTQERDAMTQPRMQILSVGKVFPLV